MLLLGMVSVMWFGVPEPAAAQSESSVRLLSVRVGIQGLSKIGGWTPVEAQVEVDSVCDLELVLLATDPLGCRVHFRSDPQAVRPGTQRILRGRFRSGRPASALEVQLICDGELVARQVLRAGTRDYPAALRQSADIVLLSGPATGFDQLATVPESVGDADTDATVVDAIPEELQIVALESLHQLPRNVLDYDAVNTVVIAGRYALEPDQSTALQTWVHRGGQLIVLVGERYRDFRDSPLADWLPIRVDAATITVRELSSLEALAGAAGTRLRFNGSLQVPVLEAPDGEILAETIDTPLVVHAACGMGQVTVVGLDFDQQPLATWDSLPAVCARLLDGRARSGESTAEQTGKRLSSSGVSDLLTQLNGALQKFPTVRRLPTWGVMGLLFAYLLLIGPLDYLIVHRVLKRPQLTWLTFPCTVVVVSGLAVAAAWSENGREIHVNQIELIDVDQRQRVCTTRAWATIYSPAARRYALSADSLLHQRLGGEGSVQPTLSWLGIPEATFGGMYREGGLEVAQPAYTLESNASQIPNLPIRLWSTRSLESRFGFPLERAPFEGTLENLGIGQLSGQIWHNLPFAIEDWILAYDTRVYLPDQPLSPGLPFPGTNWDAVSQRDLRSFLTDTRTRQVQSRAKGGVEFRTEQGVYDITGRDAGEILRMLTFYSAAGGAGYTRLQNHPLRECDLSPLLKLDRAVIFGRVDAAALELTVDADASTRVRRETYIRIALPVRSVGGELEELPVFD